MQLLAKYFPDLTQLQKMQFELLLKVFPQWNEKVNMVSRKDIHNLELKHIVHSLAITKEAEFAPNNRVIDIGTGGGFPGIPLAIFYPHVKFILCDSITKKVKVVEALIDLLELPNAKAFNGRAEESNSKFDYAVNRAVAPLQKLINWSENIVSKKMYSLKGGDLEEEIADCNRLTTQTPLTNYFEEDYFETKSILISLF